MTRDEFIARVSDIIRRSNVDDEEVLIELLVAHVKEEFPPGCGEFDSNALWRRAEGREKDNSQGICVLPEGHEGYHKDAGGYGWMTY